MAVTIRQLDASEIGQTSQLDCSNIVHARYECEQPSGELRLRLRRQPVSPALARPDWGAQERETRYQLWRNNLEHDGCIMHGAFREDRLVGIVLTGRLADGITAEIYTLHVHHPERGGGIGTQLMDKAESQAAKWGCSQVLVYTGYECGAVDFYLRRGYRVVGIQDPCVATKNFPITLLRQLEQHR
jgi:GNAT superfamily N-acetyltransferase